MLGEDEISEIYGQLGKILSQFHSIKYEDFGRIVKRKEDFGVKPSSEDYKDYLLEKYFSWLERAKGTVFEGELPRLKEWLKENTWMFERDIKPRLIHDDFDPSNILVSVEDVEVKGIVDLDLVKAGNHVSDLYRIYQHFEGEKGKIAVESFLDNYSIDLPDNFEEQVDFYRLTHPLAYLDCWTGIERDYSEEGLKDMKEFVRQSIQDILED